MDLLGELLLSVRVDSSSIGVFHSSSDWGLDMPQMDRSAAVLYCVLESPCWLLREGQASQPLNEGDCVLVLGEAKVGMASQQDAAREPFLDLWRREGLPYNLNSRSRRDAPIHFGSGNGQRSPRLLTVAYVLHEPERNQLLTNLPDVLLLQRQGSFSERWALPTLDWLMCEEANQKPGFWGAATLLAGFILTSFLRDYILLIPKGQSGWLGALTDPRLGKALVLIHSLPEMDWSIDALASEANMSRATFSRRFKTLIGESPGQYLIANRIRHAARELIKGDVTIADLAERYGYQSESAFRIAFKKQLGVGPREYLRLSNSH